MIGQYVLRHARLSDIEFLFALANDPEVRNSSINTATISFQEHQEWFREKLSSPRSTILIFENTTEPVGQIRFDLNETERVWEIDYAISPKHRGKGLGKLIVKNGIQFFGRFPVCAYVKENNLPSQAIFHALEFSFEGTCYIKNQALVKYFKQLAE